MYIAILRAKICMKNIKNTFNSHIIFKEELYLVHIVIYILTPALEALELFVPWFGDKFIQLIKLFIVLWCVCEILTRSGFMIYELFQCNSHMLYLNRKR